MFSNAQKAQFDKYVESTRVRAARNVSGFSLPPGSSQAREKDPLASDF